jgi:hypothetical protein
MDAETRNIQLALGEFTRTLVDQQGRDPTRLVREAVVYYLSDSDRPAWRHPRLASEPENQVRLDLTLPKSDWRGLERQVEEQGVPLESLLEHVVLYYLADLDSGRAAARLVDGDELADIG